MVVSGALCFLAFFCHNAEIVGGFALRLFGASAGEAEESQIVLCIIVIYYVSEKMANSTVALQVI